MLVSLVISEDRPKGYEIVRDDRTLDTIPASPVVSVIYRAVLQLSDGRQIETYDTLITTAVPVDNSGATLAPQFDHCRTVRNALIKAQAHDEYMAVIADHAKIVEASHEGHIKKHGPGVRTGRRRLP